MEDLIKKQTELLIDFRKAHRIINECQTCILDLIFKVIIPSLGLPQRDLEVSRLFCSPLRSKDPKMFKEKTFCLRSDNWAWDLIYTHVLEYYLGDTKKGDLITRYSLIQVSDTGSYLTNEEGYKKKDSTIFPNVKDCDSLLIFKMKKDCDKMHTTEETIHKIVNQNNPVYTSSNKAVYFKTSLLNFMNRDDAEKTINQIKEEFKKHGAKY